MEIASKILENIAGKEENADNQYLLHFSLRVQKRSFSWGVIDK